MDGKWKAIVEAMAKEYNRLLKEHHAGRGEEREEPEGGPEDARRERSRTTTVPPSFQIRNEEGDG